jgi:hypothetical protein
MAKLFIVSLVIDVADSNIKCEGKKKIFQKIFQMNEKFWFGTMKSNFCFLLILF